MIAPRGCVYMFIICLYIDIINVCTFYECVCARVRMFFCVSAYVSFCVCMCLYKFYMRMCVCVRMGFVCVWVCGCAGVRKCVGVR